MILTRFLYVKDEVELSLLTALLKKEDLKIIYYWAYELYYSGFEAELFDLLWKIYLDFYYVHQPYFSVYFKKKHDLWKADKKMNHVAFILRNMYNLKADGGVFLVRQKFAQELSPTILYKYKYKHSIFDNLLLSLERKHFENIWYHLKALLERGSSINEINQVVASFLKVDIDPNVSLHYLQAVIYKTLFANNNDDKKEKHIYVMPRQEHLDEMLRLEKEVIPLTKKGNVQTYNTLLLKRMVSIDDNIGSFEMVRWQYKDLQREHWFHWEYYAMRSPLWMKRLEKHGGFVNHDLRKIEFTSEKSEEDFYDVYAYELDELPKEVQLMSMKPVLKSNGSMWFNYVFGIDVGTDAGECTEDTNKSWQWNY